MVRGRLQRPHQSAPKFLAKTMRKNAICTAFATQWCSLVAPVVGAVYELPWEGLKAAVCCHDGLVARLLSADPVENEGQNDRAELSPNGSFRKF